ncbi:MAG: 4-demethylwyosine synthase TYW1 [Methanotrichaceae archaeon]|nr:4-demethylwyosine synthase TYW1 [Methanotrichaceae archaeon]
MSNQADPTLKSLSKQGYHLFGHAAVKPCLWLNRSLRGGDQCYKHHFYGISSHRCVQMTPTLHCNHLCLHCWRPVDEEISLPDEWLEPDELLDGILREQMKLISGYGGSPVVDMARLEEARHPAQVAISLMGEPTFYPHLDRLIQEINRRGMTSFLVSNGSHPDVLARVRPTQLYVSLNAIDRDHHRRVSNPREDTWDRILESLSLISDHPSRTVVRLTLARNHNIEDHEGFAKLLETARPDFVEVKAYMHLGRSRDRLERESMPNHGEIMEFSRKLATHLGYEMVADVPLSRVALLSRSSVEPLIIRS